MKNKKRVRTLAALLAVMLCMTAFSTVAYAGGGDGEPYYTEQPTESAEPTPQPQEETGGIEPQPLTPDGNMTLVDDIDGEADKQFITVVTKNGNYFYIIIDRADDGENTVHFLNQVDEADLLALMEEEQAEEKPVVCTCSERCEAGSVNAACPVCKNNMSECAGKETVTVIEPDPEEKSGGSPLLILLVLLLLGGGGALAYIKLIKPKQSVKGGTDLDELDFDEDDEDSDIYQPVDGEQEDEE